MAPNRSSPQGLESATEIMPPPIRYGTARVQWRVKSSPLSLQRERQRQAPSGARSSRIQGACTNGFGWTARTAEQSTAKINGYLNRIRLMSCIPSLIILTENPFCLSNYLLLKTFLKKLDKNPSWVFNIWKR